MNHEQVKAHLNLYAVLQNLEDLVTYDEEMAGMAKNWDISIQFSVRNGPRAWLEFKNGKCSFQEGNAPHPTVKLFFISASHFNKMMDGKGTPIPLKGFTKLSFLSGDFTKLTDKLEYYLKPGDPAPEDETWISVNTRMTLNTAAFSVKELCMHDPTGILASSHMKNGTVLLKILPDGPAAHVTFQDGEITVGKGDVDKPMACMLMKNMKVANDFLNGKMDSFTAVAAGDVVIRGQLSMLDSLGLVLDRIPCYLQ